MQVRVLPGSFIEHVHHRALGRRAGPQRLTCALARRMGMKAKSHAHAGSRARVTSMGGLYDAATLHALMHMLKGLAALVLRSFSERPASAASSGAAALAGAPWAPRRLESHEGGAQLFVAHAFCACQTARGARAHDLPFIARAAGAATREHMRFPPERRAAIRWTLVLPLGQRASCGIRTHDLPLTKRVLCQLS